MDPDPVFARGSWCDFSGPPGRVMLGGRPERVVRELSSVCTIVVGGRKPVGLSGMGLQGDSIGRLDDWEWREDVSAVGS